MQDRKRRGPADIAPVSVCRRGYCSGSPVGEEGFCAMHQAAIDADRAMAASLRSVRGRAALCGTPGGYRRHRRLGEEACDACKRGWAAAEKGRDDRRRAAA